MLRFALRNLLAARWRLVLTGLAVVLGVAFVSGTFVLTDSTGRAFDTAVAEAGDGVDTVVRGTATVSEDAREPVPAGLAARVRAVDGVRAAEGTASGGARLIRDGAAAGTTLATAQTWVSDPDLSSWRLRAGRAPAGDGEVVVDAATASREGIGTGDVIRVQFPVGAREVTVVGIAGFGGEDSMAATTTFLVSPDAARTLLLVPGWTQIDVAARDGVSEEELRDRVARVLPAGAEAVTGETAQRETSEQIDGILAIFRGVLLAFGLVSLFVGAFIIVNTFAITLAQRQRQLALLRAVGASPAQIVRSVMLEAVVVGVLASVVGLVAGLGVAAALQALLDATGVPLPSDGLSLAPRTVVLGLLLGVGVTLLAALRPAVRAARVAPVAALRDAAITTEAPARRRRLVALGVTGVGVLALATGLLTGIPRPVYVVGAGAALVFVGAAALLREVARPLAAALGAPLAALGLSARLGRANAMRNPQRTARTAAALMVGLALVTGASVFAASLKGSIGATLDERVRADAIVSSDMGTFQGDVAGALASAPGIASASVVETAPARVDGASTEVVAADPATLADSWDVGVTAGRLAGLEAPGTVMVRADVADERGLAIGDPVTAVFASGERTILRVVGTYEDDTLGDWLVSDRTYDAVVTVPQVLVAFARGADGTGPDATVAAARAALADFPALDVRTADDFVADQERQIDQLLAVVIALLAMALVIAVVGIVNTLALSVLERTREIGMLRAVGMERRAVRRMVRVEAVVTALVGAAAGVAVGIPLGIAVSLRVPGVDQVSVPAGHAVGALLLAALAGVIAAALPARRAARLDVLRAVAAE